MYLNLSLYILSLPRTHTFTYLETHKNTHLFLLESKLKTHTWTRDEIGNIFYLFVAIVGNPWIVIVGNLTCVVGWTRNLGLIETFITQT